MIQRVGVSVSVAVASFFLCVLPLSAATNGASDTQTLHLDGGFVGRNVSLELFGGKVRISWGKGDLRKATDVTVTFASSSQPVLSWSKPDAIRAKNVLVTVKGAWMKQGTASWYRYKRCNCAASVDFPKGTKLRVTRVDKPEKSVVVRVNDYGPERDKFPNRAIDLDAVAFKALAPLHAGVIQVMVEPI